MDTFHFIDLKLWDKVVSINNAEKINGYQTVPNIGELFLFVDTEGTFRARRIRDPVNSERIRIYLIDTGKVLELKFEAESYYELPNHLNFPDLSTKCKLKNACNTLKDLLFKKVVLRKIWITDEEFPGFIDEYELLYVEPENKSPAKELPKELPKKILSEGISKDTLTQEELDVLNEEPLNTNDPMLATLGYSVEDDNRCQFYDEKTGGCFKRGRCYKDHFPEDNHDLRSQTQIFFDNIPLQLELPAVNSIIFIFPLHFEAINLLYAHIIQPNKIYIDSKTDLMKLNMMMNTPAAIRSYELIEEIPAINQLVIALGIKDKYYRAKVCDVNDNDTCNVFFVDYGYKLTIDTTELRRYKVQYNFLPFQAVPLIIGNVQAGTNPFTDMVAVEQLNIWIKQNYYNFHAKVL